MLLFYCDVSMVMRFLPDMTFIYPWPRLLSLRYFYTVSQCEITSRCNCSGQTKLTVLSLQCMLSTHVAWINQIRFRWILHFNARVGIARRVSEEEAYKGMETVSMWRSKAGNLAQQDPVLIDTGCWFNNLKNLPVPLCTTARVDSPCWGINYSHKCVYLLTWCWAGMWP